MGLWQDVQFAARLLVKDKWFTLVAMLALAFGIGVNATVFTFVNAVLIRGLPFEDGERVMALGTRDPRNERMGVSHLDFKDWSAATQSFTGLAAHSGGAFALSDEGRAPERYPGAYLSANGLQLIRVSPVIGRGFRPEDDVPGATPVLLLGSTVFKNRYGSDPAVIGRTVRVNETPAVVIGVMPEGFKFPQNADVWQPLGTMPRLLEQKRNQRNFEVLGRLKDGVSAEQARAELSTISERLAREYPDVNKDVQSTLQTFNERVNGGQIRTVFLSLMAAVAFVLLIACANVANLLLARAANRAREVSVRVSLGASRRRIVRQLLIESLLLALVSGVLGFAFARVGVNLFDIVTIEQRPAWIHFTMDYRVFAYLAAICLVTAIVFGLAPALHVARTDVNEVLKEGGRSGSAGVRVRRWAGVLVVAELALTLVLLAGAGFMMRNFMNMYRLDLGIETSHLLTMSLSLPDAKYPAVEQRLAFYERVQERLAAKFQTVSLATQVPLQGGFQRRLEIEGRPVPAGQQPPTVSIIAIDPRYFDTLGVRVVRGRVFTAADGQPGQDTAIINQRFADLHFAGEDPLGRRIVLSIAPDGGDPPPGIPRSQTVTVVGISPNVRQGGSPADQGFPPVAYLPYRSNIRAAMSLLARSDGDPKQLIPVLREEMRAIDPDLPLFNIRTMDETLAQQRWPFRVFGTMFAIFALAALLLSAIGLYAVTAYSVNQRTQEIGVRTALGAQSNQVVWLFFRRALLHLSIGLTIGIAGALGVGAIFESANLLVQVNGRDPITIGSIAMVLLVVSLTASLLPARRATQLDPVTALRRE
jgi:putative ABC transport system permease protein